MTKRMVHFDDSRNEFITISPHHDEQHQPATWYTATELRSFRGDLFHCSACAPLPLCISSTSNTNATNATNSNGISLSHITTEHGDNPVLLYYRDLAKEQRQYHAKLILDHQSVSLEIGTSCNEHQTRKLSEGNTAINKQNAFRSARNLEREVYPSKKRRRRSASEKKKTAVPEAQTIYSVMLNYYAESIHPIVNERISIVERLMCFQVDEGLVQ